MPILNPSILGLDPDIEKKKIQFLLKDNPVDYNYEIQESISLKRNFLLNSDIFQTENKIKQNLSSLAGLSDNWDGLGSKKINIQTLQNAFNIIGSIPPSILSHIDSDSIYSSSFGTIIIDFKNGENIFSLEISRKAIGYFTELNGVDDLEVDNLPIDEESFENTLVKMCHDLSIIL